MDDYEDMTEEELAAIAGGARVPYEQQALLGQQSLANALRTTEQPGVHNAGRVVVAANPLEHIGAVMERVAGHKKLKEIDARQQGIADKAFGAHMNVLRLLQRKKRDEGTVGPGTTTYFGE